MDTSQYLDLFIDETKEHLQSLNEHVLVLEKEPENEDTINEIFRAAHTLKGMSGTMGFVRMQRLTHDLENVFSEIRNGNMKVNEKLIDVLFRGLDALESYLAVISSEGNEGTEDNEDIINDLNALLEEQSGDGAAAPAQKEVKKEETPRLLLTKTCIPISFSSSLTALVSDGCEIKSCSAALFIEPCSAIVSAYFICCNVIVFLL